MFYKKQPVKFNHLTCLLFLLLFCLSFQAAFSDTLESICIQYSDVNGKGVYPFNFRVIDNKLFAGGSLFNPTTKQGNHSAKVLEHLTLLKKLGVTTIITLNVPLRDKLTEQLTELCHQTGLAHLKVRMTADTVPTPDETKQILQCIEKGAYVHCMWGCDRTGAIIGKYLTQTRNYSGAQALNAIIKNGSHSGKMGGFKEIASNNKLILYFWQNGRQY